MTNNGWIGVDFDGTLAYYDHWRGIDHVGKPIKPMCDRVRRWLSNGQRVKIFTARVYGYEGDELTRVCAPIWKFCVQEFNEPLEITCVKDMAMIQLWDDRAIRVGVNTGEII